jgi:hypothetical protein
MGHTRLRDLPRTRVWQEVVELIAGGAGAPQLANATIIVAQRGLNLASNDSALVEAVWLLTQLPLAARSGDFAGYLRMSGMNVPDSPGLMDVVGAFSEAADARASGGRRTDLGEMAQMAAAETIYRVVGERTAGLYGASAQDVATAFSSLGTVAGFGTFARDFFARLTTRCLDFFLSRAFYHHVGEGKRFTTLAQQSR